MHELIWAAGPLPACASARLQGLQGLRGLPVGDQHCTAADGTSGIWTYLNCARPLPPAACRCCGRGCHARPLQTRSARLMMPGAAASSRHWCPQWWTCTTALPAGVSWGAALPLCSSRWGTGTQRSFTGPPHHGACIGILETQHCHCHAILWGQRACRLSAAALGMLLAHQAKPLVNPGLR